MKNFKAYWNQFWHCLYLTPFDGHRKLTLFFQKDLVYIGCECGKSWHNPQKIKKVELNDLH